MSHSNRAPDQDAEANSTVDFGALPGKIVIDAVCFEWGGAFGIPRVWKTMLEQWSGTAFAPSLVVLDRAGSAPKFSGIEYIPFPAYIDSAVAQESFLIESTCRRLNARLFISTNHTISIETPSVLMVHDLIPEKFWSQSHQWVREKRLSTHHACAYVAISEHTAGDLKIFYPFSIRQPICIAPNGVSPLFRPSSVDEVASFKRRNGITNPYFLCVGSREHHKNAQLLFRAFAALKDRDNHTLICCGGKTEIEKELVTLVQGCDVRHMLLSDEDLCAAYSGAKALVYTSQYEGFGMPIAEAMACGCPVITCKNSAILEVAGDASIYVSETNVAELISAMTHVDTTCDTMVARGLQRAQLFSWKTTADKIAEFLISSEVASAAKRKSSVYPNWRRFRQGQMEKQIDEVRPLQGDFLKASSSAT